ncbi:MAG: hypothetical protein LBF93_05370 [Zoogloeaceae bacterium]|jgi:hypothetical protein|nr:hypothetical protein [Zoogloeaceae bacterium]
MSDEGISVTLSGGGLMDLGFGHDEKGLARCVAWTPDIYCGDTQFGALSLLLADNNNDKLFKASYRQLVDGKVIPPEWDYNCRACGSDGKNCVA